MAIKTLAELNAAGKRFWSRDAVTLVKKITYALTVEGTRMYRIVHLSGELSIVPERMLPNFRVE